MTSRASVDSLQAAYRHCRGITRREARNFYYAFITLPHRRRQAVYATYAFSRLVDDIADGAGTEDEKAQALADVRVRLREACSGAPDGPIFLALADTAQAFGIPESLFHDILDGVEMDLWVQRYESYEDLREYCCKVASAVGLVSIYVFGYRGEAAKEYAVDFGLAMQITNILRDLREDMERGRVYLPQDEMRRFGYTEEHLQAGVIDDNFLALMQFQVERARSYFRSGARLLPLLETRSRPCAAGLHQLYSRLLDRIEARGFDVFSSRVSLSACEKLQLTGKLWATSFIPQRPR
ncbi:MAG: presqualene diphosphate synthase HpnD [Dehalococcoidia bacterium]